MACDAKSALTLSAAFCLAVGVGERAEVGKFLDLGGRLGRGQQHGSVIGDFDSHRAFQRSPARTGKNLD